eukprot:CAMPEP_0185689378 /NCGR_PEP_ID=MMETSP1164-20130828/413_1 /TAXON_ID=1104430 /ORGANISM="Chrysoreinhardia sp, Strain CCMP2950" /LENGTH=581 /DNA_ID=CAMNT_0028355867 /DNA_START=33 /DNA_END=1778 /DNA_ORIENTATION=-
MTPRTVPLLAVLLLGTATALVPSTTRTTTPQTKTALRSLAGPLPEQVKPPEDWIKNPKLQTEMVLRSMPHAKDPPSLRLHEYTSEEEILVLAEKLSKDKGLTDLLEASLVRAKQEAERQLAPELYAALGAWPTTAEAYLDYLLAYSKATMVPQPHAAWRGWDSPEGDGAHHEALDRLCQFYFMITRDVTDVSQRIDRKHVDHVLEDEIEDEPAGAALDYGPVTLDYDATLLEDPWFGKWSKAFADSIGSFLDGRESLDPGLIKYFRDKRPDYRVHESLVDGRPNEPSGWHTFNQFAARRANVHFDVAAPSDNAVPVAPADAVLEAVHEIAGHGLLVPPLTIGRTHRFDEVADVLRTPGFDARRYAGGAAVRFRVAPAHSHRFYAPVEGTVTHREVATRDVSCDVVIDKDGHFSVKGRHDAEGGIVVKKSVGVVEIDTALPGIPGAPGDVGRVAVVALGNSPRPVVVLPAKGARLRKGDDLGFLPYTGGPVDVVVLFAKDAAKSLDLLGHHAEKSIIGVDRRVGTPIHTNLPQGWQVAKMQDLSPEYLLKQGLPFAALLTVALVALADLASHLGLTDAWRFF